MKYDKFNIDKVKQRSFAEMSQAEFSYLKRLKNEGKLSEPSEVIHNFSEFLLSKRFSEENFFDKITPKKQKEDYYRMIGDRYLSRKNLREKVKEQIKFEKGKKEKKQTGYPDWQTLLNTKLFNKPL